MKRHILITLTLATLASAALAQTGNAPATSTNTPPKTDFSNIFKNEREKNSYAIGMMWATQLKGMLVARELDCDTALLAKSFTEMLTGAHTVITEDQEHEILADLNKELLAKREEKRKQQADEARLKGERNLVDGPAFLAKNKSTPGVITLPSGLQYKVVTEGTGAIPTAEDEVTVNYRGTLIDGTEFDNSAKRGRPLVARVQGGVIKGWTEALQLMKVGSKWQIFVPSDLAYGDKPAGPQIAPNSVLIFEMELLSTRTITNAALHAAPPSAPLTSDIIKVPSAEEMKKGAKIETIKAEDLEKEKEKAKATP